MKKETNPLKSKRMTRSSSGKREAVNDSEKELILVRHILNTNLHGKSAESDEFKSFLMIRSLMDEKKYAWPGISDMIWLHKTMSMNFFKHLLILLDTMSSQDDKKRCLERLTNMFSINGLELPENVEQWLLKTS